MSDTGEYELRWRGRQSGPFPMVEINRMLDDHEIGMGHEIFYQDDWITLEEFFAARQKIAANAASHQKTILPTMPLSAVRVPLASEKSSSGRFKVSVKPASESEIGEGPARYRLLFAFLALGAGFLGAHNFYARQWMTGLLQLLLTVATFLMGFGIIASWLWAMVEALVVRRDGHGIEMI